MDRIITIIIVLIIVLLNICIINSVYDKCKLLFLLVCASIISCILFEVSSSFLFFIDKFSILKSLILCLMIDSMSIVYLFISKKIKPFKRVYVSIKDIVITFIIVGFVLITTFPISGICGLWRDDGGYQFKALELINGNNANDIEIIVDNNLSSEEKEWYFTSIEKYLTPLWNSFYVREGKSGIKNYDEEFLTRIYHNLPTFPAFLALFGKMFGVKHMQYCQILFFLLILCVFYLILDKLKIHFSLEILGLMILSFSPQMIWLSHTAFVELYLILMIMVFCYGLINYDDSSWMVGVSMLGFGLMHIVIYMVIPIAIICICLKFLVSSKKKVLTQCYISVLAYLISFFYAYRYNNKYLFSNYGFITRFIGCEEDQNAFWIVILVIIASAIAIGICFWLRRTSVKKEYINKSICLFCFLTFVISVISLKKAFSLIDVNNNQDVIMLLFIMLSTNAVLSVVLLYDMFRFSFGKEGFLKDNAWLLVFLAYTVYCNCMFMPMSKYMYYFTRYDSVYMYVLVIAGCIALNDLICKMQGKVLLLFSIAFVFLFIKPDMFLLNTYSDTILSWDAFELITENISKENSAILIGCDENDFFNQLYMGFHAAGIDPYLQNEEWDAYEQCKGLKNSGYENVYYLSDRAERKLDTIMGIKEKYSYTFLNHFEYASFFKYPTSGLDMDRIIIIQKLSD